MRRTQFYFPSNPNGRPGNPGGLERCITPRTQRVEGRSGGSTCGSVSQKAEASELPTSTVFAAASSCSVEAASAGFAAASAGVACIRRLCCSLLRRAPLSFTVKCQRLPLTWGTAGCARFLWLASPLERCRSCLAFLEPRNR